MPIIVNPTAANPSSTRAELRREIARALQEPFNQAVQGNYLTAASGSTKTLVDTDLSELWDGQEMKGAWLYMVTGDNAGAERRIASFVASTGTFAVRPAFSNAVAANDRYEVHWRTSAEAKHRAIDRALRSTWPDWYSVGYHDMVICEDETVYDSTLALPGDIRRVLRVALEPGASTTAEFIATAGTTLTVTVSTAQWATDEWDGYVACFYDGQGRGQSASIDSNTATALTFTAALETAPASGTRFIIKSTDDESDWWEIDDIEFQYHGGPYVGRMVLPERLQTQRGERLRLYYLSDMALMDDDADATYLPREWLVAECVAQLLTETHLPWEPLVAPVPAEALKVQRQMVNDWRLRAEELRRRLRWRRPNETRWLPTAARQRGGQARLGLRRFFD